MTDSYAWTDLQTVTVTATNQPLLPKPEGGTAFRAQFTNGVDCRCYYWGVNAQGALTWSGQNEDAPGPSQWHYDTIGADTTGIQTGMSGQWAQGPPQADSTMDLTYQWYAPAIPTYCEYGTELQEAGTFMVYLTPALLDVVLAEAGMPWLASFFTAFWFTTVDARSLCGSGRPPMPQLSAGDLIWPALGANPMLSGVASFFDSGKLRQALDSVLWGHFCKCIDAPAGAPAPVPYPAPAVQPQPTGAVPPPAFDCDPNNMCATLAEIGMLTSWNFRLLGQVLNGLAGLQTSTAPAGLVNGPLHAGLSGTGVLAVSAPAGLVVQVTTMPPGVSARLTPAADYFGVGEISVGTDAGWLTRMKVQHNPHVFVPLVPGVTQVGYEFVPGTVANVQELVAP